MSTISFSLYRFRKAILVDVCLLAFLFFLPTLSHLSNIPLYRFEPMRLALFTSILLLHDKRNAYVLAFSLPLFSYLVSGHPIAVKNAIMAIELFVNVYILQLLLNRKVNCYISCFLSIIVSKIVYYAIKSLAIFTSLLNARIIDTSVFIQILITLLISVLFGITFYKRNNCEYGQ